MSSFSSKILNDAVNEFSRLPGIGKRSALRLVLHLLKVPAEDVQRLGHSMLRLREEINYCRICYNISDKDICGICSDARRDNSVICVVEDIRDIIAIEIFKSFGPMPSIGEMIPPSRWYLPLN